MHTSRIKNDPLETRKVMNSKYYKKEIVEFVANINEI